MLLAADWPGRARRGDVLVDSMRIRHARHRSGHDSCRHSTWYHALELGFAGWSGHDEALWQEVLDMADTRAQEGSRSRVIYAGDECEREGMRGRAPGGHRRPAHRFLCRSGGHGRGACPTHHGSRPVRELLARWCGTSRIDAPCMARSSQPYLLASGVLDTAVMLTEGPDADAYLGMERTRGYACMNGSASCDIALFDPDV